MIEELRDEKYGTRLRLMGTRVSESKVVGAGENADVIYAMSLKQEKWSLPTLYTPDGGEMRRRCC